MKKHFIVVFWALHVLWGLKPIWPSDRLRLWRKSFNLYAAFLAFTDQERPTDQLRAAMLCAVLSAVYDYDSDWLYGDRSGNNFKKLITQHIELDETRDLATNLFNQDVKQTLTTEGLERGGKALVFYRAVINSKWMRSYSKEDIFKFGCELQILDDLLDLRQDRLSGDKNCLLVAPENSALRAKQFLAGDFFRRLTENSSVYHKLKNKAQKLLAGFEAPGEITFGQLFRTAQPRTGVYAFALTLVSFKFFHAMLTPAAATAALAFTGLTYSIMCFNTYRDRFHDRRKFKFFAYKHPEKVFNFWLLINAITVSLLALLAWQDILTAMFCALVWALGIAYSFIPHWLVAQNLVVAFCAASPALCGSVYQRHVPFGATMTFALFFLLIWTREIHMDTEDMDIDPQYKRTLPGTDAVRTWAHLCALTIVTAVPFALHPNPWVVGIGLVALPFLEFRQALVFCRIRSTRIIGALSTTTWVLSTLTIILLLTS